HGELHVARASSTARPLRGRDRTDDERLRLLVHDRPLVLEPAPGAVVVDDDGLASRSVRLPHGGVVLPAPGVACSPPPTRPAAGGGSRAPSARDWLVLSACERIKRRHSGALTCRYATAPAPGRGHSQRPKHVTAYRPVLRSGSAGRLAEQAVRVVRVAYLGEPLCTGAEHRAS